MASEVDEVKQNAVADGVEDSEELFYAAAVQILSEDLYPRKLEIIREYIQNASDALDDWMKISDLIPSDRTEPQIKVSIQGKSVLDGDFDLRLSSIRRNQIGYFHPVIKSITRILDILSDDF